MLVFKKVVTDKKNVVMRLGFEALFDQFQKSLIVLSNPKTILNDRYAPKDVKSQVIRADQLINILKSMKSASKYSKKEMLNDGNNILSMNHDDRKDYLEKFLKLKEEIEVEAQPALSPAAPSQTPAPVEEAQPAEKLCPKCGSKLVLRTAKKGNYQGNQFWGCSRYPKCRYMENLIPDHD